jgi:hypothetical protein
LCEDISEVSEHVLDFEDLGTSPAMEGWGNGTSPAMEGWGKLNFIIVLI